MDASGEAVSTRDSEDVKKTKNYLMAYLIQQQESYDGIIPESPILRGDSLPLRLPVNGHHNVEADGPEERSRSLKNGSGHCDAGTPPSHDENTQVVNGDNKIITSRRNRMFNSDPLCVNTFSDTEEPCPEINKALETGCSGNNEEENPKVNGETAERKNTKLRHRDCSGGSDDTDEINGERIYVKSDGQLTTFRDIERDVSREMTELLRLGTFDQKQVGEMHNKRKKQAYLNNLTARNKHSNNVELIPFHFDVDGIPLNWTDDDISTGSHGISYSLVDLHSGVVEYDVIKEEFEAAGLEVTTVQRIQNKYLLDRFKSEMEEVKRRQHSDFDLNVKYLYHGTLVDKQRICEEGLDQRLSRLGFFGKGIYFSDNPMKCVSYAQNMDNLGQAYILKCRVILGDSKRYPKGQYDTTLKREPEKENSVPGMWRYYDSVVGCPKDFNEYVVYENRRAMIEYIIFFNETGGTFPLLQAMVTARPPIAANRQLNTVSGANNSYNPSSNSDDADDHLYRIQQVRESVRRKRCEEKGIPYSQPTDVKLQKDQEIWSRIQKVHRGSSQEVGVQPSEELCNTLTNNDVRMIEEQPRGDNHKDDWFCEAALYGAGFPHGEDNSVIPTDPDPVDEVMSGLIQEFLIVTGSDSVETSKYYLEKAQMNVNNAIVMYYDDMP